MISNEKVNPSCPMDALLRLLMGPWTTYILWCLYSRGPLRFGDLRRAIPDISAKVLTERLRMLVMAGLVDRDYKPAIPPQVSYSLTEKGRELHGVLDHLNALARKWANDTAAQAFDAQPAAQIAAITSLPSPPPRPLTSQAGALIDRK
jgi:DNA-binding HxlR family transcriptional regulator